MPKLFRLLFLQALVSLHLHKSPSMKVIYVSFLFLGCLFCQNLLHAQETESYGDTSKMHIEPTPVRQLYWGNGMDAAIFSTTFMKKTGEDQKLTTLRFTYEINFGFNLNYDFNKSTGFFTGLGIKNIGFIEKIKDSTIKRRVYTIGIPLGFKFGNMAKKNYAFIGGGADIPFNYKEKGFKDRKDKQKFNEWFTDRTPLLMPYAFVGFCVAPGFTFKIQYYFDNFLNPNFREKDVTPAPGQAYPKPYAAYEKTNMLMLNFGFDIHYKKQEKHQDKDDDDAGSEPVKSM